MGISRAAYGQLERLIERCSCCAVALCIRSRRAQSQGSEPVFGDLALQVCDYFIDDRHQRYRKPKTQHDRNGHNIILRPKLDVWP